MVGGYEAVSAIKWTQIGLEVMYHKGLFYDYFFLESLLMTDDEVLCEISKFADGTKIVSRVNTLNDIR